jgi:hypothetical protein
MHIDYIRDVNNLPNGQPTELNLTAFPTLFFAQYDTEIKGETQSSNTSTTSYSTSTKKTLGGKVSFGIPDIASVKASFKEAAERSHDHTVAAKHDTYQSVEFDVSKQTGFADVLWFTSNRFNVYYSPVLGQTVCPLVTPDCSDAEKLPLHVQFSGPDIIQHARLGGSVVEWHQPLTEPGNVFSYPWNLEQLKAVSPPDFAPLSPIPPTLWATDGSGSTVSVNWSQGGATKGTSGTTTTHSFDKSASVSADVDIDGFGASADAGIDDNSSRSINTDNTSSDTLGSSNGIQIIRPGFENPGDFAYNAETYIFGQLPPVGVIQELPVQLGISTGGTLSVASTANPLGPNGGSWWKQAYTLPDVALNHPLRWNWIPPIDPNQPDRFTFNKADTKDPAVSEFYFMRGLFITPLQADGEGPQRTTATVGDELKIEARVYNYSPIDMPPGTKLIVRFFVQEWDNTKAEFTGLSTVIGEQTLDPLPGFNSESGESPNWTIADATFDTGDYGDKYLVFWVLAWPEAASGALLPEIEGHGLTMLPANDIDFITGVPVEAYSNNVGFYKQPIFVKPAEDAVDNASMTQVDEGLDETLSVESVTVRPETSKIHEKTMVNAILRAGDTAAGPVQVFFYDGDREREGELFDLELVPFLRNNDDYLTRVAYRPTSCGLHTIFVEAVSQLPGTETRALDMTDFTVTVDAVAATRDLIKTVRGLGFSDRAERRLIWLLRQVKESFRADRTQLATWGLRAFIYSVSYYVNRKNGKSISENAAEVLIRDSNHLIACSRFG